MYTERYTSKSSFPYADGMFMIMPSGLPERFYPAEKTRKHKTKDYVICFAPDVPENIKQHLIKDYAEYHQKKQEEQLSGSYKD